MVNYVQDKAEVAKEDCQDRMCLPIYSTSGGGGGSGPDRDNDGDPTDQDRDSSSEQGGVLDFLSEGEGAEEDCLRIWTRKIMMGHLGVSQGDEGPGVTQDPGDQKDLGYPQGRWNPGEFPGDSLPLVWETQSCNPQM